MPGSESQLGPDWWQASDGLWYPAETTMGNTPDRSSQATATLPSGVAKQRGADTASESPFVQLFDVSMSRLITPHIIKLLYIVAIVFSVLTGLVVLVGAFGAETGFGVLLGVLLAPLITLFGVVFWRVLLEVVIVLFRIESSTRRANEVAPETGPQPTLFSGGITVGTPQSTALGVGRFRTLGILALIGGAVSLPSPWLPFVREEPGFDRERDSLNGWDTAEFLADFERYSIGPSLILLGALVIVVAGFFTIINSHGLTKKQSLGISWVVLGGGALVGVNALASLITLEDLWMNQGIDYLTHGGGLILAMLAGLFTLVVGLVAVGSAVNISKNH